MTLVWRLLAVCVALCAAPAASEAQATGAIANATLVMPFENPQSDARLYWLGEGSAVLIAEQLQRLGASIVSRDERLTAFERLQLPPAASLSHATMIKVGQFVGASEVVIGAYEMAGDHLTLRARAIRLDQGQLLPEVIERGPLTDLFGIYERAARRLRGDAAAAASAALAPWASPQVFEQYVKGLIAETPSTQRTYLEQALKLAPDDARIRLALWQSLTDLGEHARALDVARAVPDAGPHGRAARYLAALSRIDLRRYEEAFNELKALQSEARSAEVLNALGVVQLRRGSSPQTGRAVYYFTQATQTDPGDADYFFNLGYGYWLDKDPPAAIYWLREAVRRDPADGDAHYLLGTALQQTSAVAEAAREKELARRLSSTYAEWDARAQAGGDPIPKGLERIKERLDLPGRRVATTLTSAGQRDQAELAAFHLEAARRAYARESDREAEQELRRALFLSPYLAEGHLLLGRVHLRGGRAADAIQALKIALWSEASAPAHVALAEAYLQMQNLDAARYEVERALALDPQSAEAAALKVKLARPRVLN